MYLNTTLRELISNGFKEKFGAELSPDQISLQPTRKEFSGNYTFVVFPFLKISKMGPEQTGEALGNFLKEYSDIIKSFNVVKGFLNLEISDKAWIEVFSVIYSQKHYGFSASNDRKIMVEFSSPNTNKPLHLGHLRNNFLGYSIARIYEALGFEVIKAQIINDRGIHICKSMVAWLKFGKGETPEASGMKGDKLVGKYYVQFDKQYKIEIAKLLESGLTKEKAEKEAPIMVEAQEMLLKWEAKEPEVYGLWETMNGWVYRGFEKTYEQMGVTFDELYYESQTYLLGKEKVQLGIENGVFYRKKDNSVWVDLTEDGLDEKILLRSDGTAVYMTQDIGTAIHRFEAHPGMEKLVYTVGNEQDYHFKVLFLILKKLGFKWAEGCYHLSYGMVDLPSGKMKSREGTVVDADDLMDEMQQTAKKHTQELGKIDGFTEEQAEELYRVVGIGALKYFLLKVDPKKRMLFDPEESIQFHGNTGPFIQYTHARICAIIRKAKEMDYMQGKQNLTFDFELHEHEREVIYLLSLFGEKITEAAIDYSPYVICQYIFDLAKEYNKFYQEVSIFNEPDQDKLMFRIAFSETVARTIKTGMGLMGIEVPERM